MIVGAIMRTLWVMGAGVLLLCAGIAGADAASAAPGGDCPTNEPVAIGLVCHETEPAPVAPDTGQRVAVVKACLDAQLAKLVGAQTGHGFIPSQEDLIKVELYCKAPVVVVPVPVTPPTAGQNLNNNPTPVPVTG